MKTKEELIMQGLYIAENTIGALRNSDFVPTWCKRSLQRDLRKIVKARQAAEAKLL